MKTVVEVASLIICMCRVTWGCRGMGRERVKGQMLGGAGFMGVTGACRLLSEEQASQREYNSTAGECRIRITKAPISEQQAA